MQYIQEGILEIDTTNARWVHKTSTNGSMAFSYYGEIESRTLTVGPNPEVEYNVSKFQFQVPILINGSAVVKISGPNSLAVSSKEGIFIGVDIDVGKTKVEIDRTVGGFCFNPKKASGNTSLTAFLTAKE